MVAKEKLFNSISSMFLHKKYPSKQKRRIDKLKNIATACRKTSRMALTLIQTVFCLTIQLKTQNYF